MRAVTDLCNVLLPSLTGDFVLGVVGNDGYSYGILAPSESAFMVSARRLMVREGERKVLFAPAWVRVVSLSSRALGRFTRRHAEELREYAIGRIESRACDYHRTFNHLPEGFTACDEDAPGAFSIDYGSTYARWTGEGSLLERFASTVDPYRFDKSGGAPSTAPPSRSTTPWLACRGYRGSGGEGFGVCTSAGRHYAGVVISNTPMFYFEISQYLPRLLTPVQAEIVAHDEARKAEKLRQEAARTREREAVDARRREELAAMFGS